MLGKYPLAGTSQFLEFPQDDAIETKSQNDMLMCFVLNRQYRNWHYSYRWNGDILEVRCNTAIYNIHRNVVDNASGFSWESAQARNARYDNVSGTFGFISKAAYAALLAKGRFTYDGITWRKVDETAENIHVRADKDNTEMWIAKDRELPIVMKMKNNPLGIDWDMKQ